MPDRRGTSLILALALASAAVACRDAAKPQAEAAAKGPERAEEALREVELVPVELTELEQGIEISGTLAADEQVILATKVAGRLASIGVDLASAVKAGQVVAQIETTDYELGVQQARAALGQARAQLGLGPKQAVDALDPEATALVRQAQATLEEAKASASRLGALAEQGLAPQAELDTARAALGRAEAGLIAAREEVRLRQAQVRQRQSELAAAEQRLSDTAIRSPIDGFVQERRARAGEYLAMGAPVADVVRIDPLRLRLALPEREASSVRQGQTVELVTEASGAAYAGATHTGKVARIAPSLDAQSRSLLIEADIPNPGSLRPGNFVRARILLGQRSVPAVPSSAIVTFAGLQKVILVKDGKAVEQLVTTGESEGDRVEIVSGVKVGDAVVRVPGALQHGQAVRISGS